MSERQPHILVSNDDGYLAPGLLALVNAVRPLGRITVIAPEQNHSGASNSLTLSRPLSIHRVAGGERDGFFFINGTPTDCVHVAMTGFLEQKVEKYTSTLTGPAQLEITLRWAIYLSILVILILIM